MTPISTVQHLQIRRTRFCVFALVTQAFINEFDLVCATKQRFYVTDGGNVEIVRPNRRCVCDVRLFLVRHPHRMRDE